MIKIKAPSTHPYFHEAMLCGLLNTRYFNAMYILQCIFLAITNTIIAVESIKNERQASYPKAGLILRTSSFKDSAEEDSTGENLPTLIFNIFLMFNNYSRHCRNSKNGYHHQLKKWQVRNVPIQQDKGHRCSGRHQPYEMWRWEKNISLKCLFFLEYLIKHTFSENQPELKSAKIWQQIISFLISISCNR